MPKEFSRSRRVAEQIQRVLAEAIARDRVRADGLKLATFTDVEVSRDLAHAKVFVSKIGSDDPSGIVDVLNIHARELRSELARQLRIRTVPALKFLPDTATVTGDRMERLIAAARSTDADHGKPSEEDNG